MILALTNLKGGVGKTTTAVNLASALGSAGLSVLLVDLDPQASATHSLGFEASHGRGGEPDDRERDGDVADVLLRDATVRQSVRATNLEGVELLAGSLELATAELELARRDDAATRLAEPLRAARRSFDVALIDCAPGLSLPTLMGLRASQAYLVPTTPHELAFDAVERFFEALQQVGAELGRAPYFLGLLLTMVDHRTRVTDDQVERLRRRYRSKVLQTEIPVNIQLAVAPSRGRTIFDHQGWSAGAAAYRKLGGEVLRRARRAGLL